MDRTITLILLICEAIFAFFLLYRCGSLKSRTALFTGAAVIAAAFVLRWFALPHETADYRDFLAKWVLWFRENGGFAALNRSIGNYNIPYLYFLAAFSYLPLKDLYLIKLLSIFFDCLLAFAVCRTVSLFREEKTLQILSFAAVLLWPTVVLNGSYWGQCDSVYVSLALLGFCAALRDRPVRSMILIALSFSFKLQAVFLMPAYVLFLFHGKIRWKHFLLFPAAYVVTVLPAVIAGRPFVETISLYYDQIDTVGTGLNYNSPSVFAFLDHQNIFVDQALLTKAGIALAFLFMAAIFLLCLLRRKRLTGKTVVLAAAILSLGIPFLLPRMHDRYFFGADMLTLMVCFLFPETVPAALLTGFASFLGYYAYLTGHYLLLMRTGSVCLILALLLLQFVFFRATSATGEAPSSAEEKDA